MAGSLGAAAPARRPAGRWPAPLAGLLALAAGVLHTAAFAPVLAWWLQPLALALLWGLARGGSARRAAWLGWCFGLGWLASGLWWLYISMHQFGGLPGPLAALAVWLLAAWLALYYAAALALWARWGGRTPWARVAAAAGCWLLAELARASWFSGFPWLASGYAHSAGPLAGWAPWIGVYGISALGAALAAGLAELVAALLGRAEGEFLRARRGGRGSAVAALALLLLVLAGPLALPRQFTQSTGLLAVSLVQPNVAQNLKFDAGHLEANLAGLRAQVGQARGAVVVTPESVVPLPFDLLPAAYWQDLHQALAAKGQAALLGVFLPAEGEGGSGRYVNSMVGLAAGQPPEPGRFYHYGKRHLLPFGEFIPPGFGWFVRAMNIPLDDQAAGTRTQAWAVAGQRLRPLICYEDLFGEDFVASVRGPQAATVLVNASNLAWFGPRMVQDQHLQFSVMRALEFQRPVVRATNTGATAVVHHDGRVGQRLPPEVAGVLEVQVEGRQGDTPYACWLHAAGLAPLWVLALLLLGVGALSARRGGRGGVQAS